MSNAKYVFLSFSFLLPWIAGCDSSPKVVPISGQVLIDGKPLDFGYIRFLPQQSRLSGSALDSDGRFSLTFGKGKKGAVLGPHQVEILACKPLSDTKLQWYAPKKYSSASTSGLAYNVTGPADDVKFELTWGGAKPFVETIDGGTQEGANPY